MTDRTKELEARVAHLQNACAKSGDEICQTLGKVLGYPWYKDDQKNFPGATEIDGVCVGEHVAETIAAEAANKIRDQQKEIDFLKQESEKWFKRYVEWKANHDNLVKINAMLRNRPDLPTERVKAVQEFVDALKRQEDVLNKYKSMCKAAATEIEEHWDAHCDKEGYGPINLLRRLKGELPPDEYHGAPWQTCKIHGPADPHAWACPECLRELRNENKELTRQLDEMEKMMVRMEGERSSQKLPGQS